jgi:hypothetical protein
MGDRSATDLQRFLVLVRLVSRRAGMRAKVKGCKLSEHESAHTRHGRLRHMLHIGHRRHSNQTTVTIQTTDTAHTLLGPLTLGIQHLAITCGYCLHGSQINTLKLSTACSSRTHVVLAWLAKVFCVDIHLPLSQDSDFAMNHSCSVSTTCSTRGPRGTG